MHGSPSQGSVRNGDAQHKKMKNNVAILVRILLISANSGLHEALVCKQDDKSNVDNPCPRGTRDRYLLTAKYPTSALLKRLPRELRAGLNLLCNLPACLSSPCTNNGTCRETLDGFICVYSPETVEDPKSLYNMSDNACLSSPCTNNGTCRETPDGFICVHSPETFQDPRSLYNMSDNETIYEAEEKDYISYLDYDDTSFSGNVAACLSSPCSNDGLCLETADGYRCQCNAGSTGALCEILLDPCSTSPCFNNGRCVSVDTNEEYECYCPDFYFGMNCEIKMTCSSVTCQNGGTCYGYDDPTLAFYCLCTSCFSGHYCEGSFQSGAWPRTTTCYEQNVHITSPYSLDLPKRGTAAGCRTLENAICKWHFSSPTGTSLVIHLLYYNLRPPNHYFIIYEGESSKDVNRDHTNMLSLSTSETMTEFVARHSTLEQLENYDVWSGKDSDTRVTVLFVGTGNLKDIMPFKVASKSNNITCVVITDDLDTRKIGVRARVTVL